MEPLLESAAALLLEGPHKTPSESHMCRETATDLAIALIVHALWTSPARLSRSQSRSRSSSNASSSSSSEAVELEIEADSSSSNSTPSNSHSKLGDSHPKEAPLRTSDKRHRWSALALRIAESIQLYPPSSPAENKKEQNSGESLGSAAHLLRLCRAADRCIRLNFNLDTAASVSAKVGYVDLELNADEAQITPASPTVTEHSITSTGTASAVAPLGVPASMLSSDVWNGFPSPLEAMDVQERAAKVMGIILGLTPPSSGGGVQCTQSPADDARTAILQACVDELEDCTISLEGAGISDGVGEMSSVSVQLKFYRLIGEVFQMADSAVASQIIPMDEFYFAKVNDFRSRLETTL